MAAKTQAIIAYNSLQASKQSIKLNMGLLSTLSLLDVTGGVKYYVGSVLLATFVYFLLQDDKPYAAIPILETGEGFFRERSARKKYMEGASNVYRQGLQQVKCIIFSFEG